MNSDIPNSFVISKLNTGMKFGLFGSAQICYFQDGSKVKYSELWAAIKEIHNLKNAHNKTLSELYPGTYAGAYSYNYFWHSWKKTGL